MAAYYNEIDTKAAAWLRELIRGGHIAPGDVDERSISDVKPDDLKTYTQCHFFAGIGVWSYALRQAGWPDDRPVWTGSCPCQPFSIAGKRKGASDERHLWPQWHWLIQQCEPAEVFGEQVASKDGRAWLDTVQADMEALGFAIGAADLCAAGVGAPHIRQRIWFYGTRDLAYPSRSGLQRRRGPVSGEYDAHGQTHPRSADDRLADAQRTGSQGRCERRDGAGQRVAGSSGLAGGLAYTAGHGRVERGSEPDRRGADTTGASEWMGDTSGTASERQPRGVSETQTRECEAHREVDGDQSVGLADASGGVGAGSAHPTNGFWRDVDWLGCRDGKWRPVEPGTFPLAHGSPAKVGRLRGYGNAIVAPVAQIFIEASQGWE